MEATKNIYIVLDNIKYAQNIGPIFRLADAFKVKKIFLCRGKIQRLNPNQERILYKASRGAVKWVEWEFKTSCLEVIKDLKSQNIDIIGVETGNNAELINETVFHSPVALVFGAEDDGISEEVLKLCDKLVKIPMYGKGKSLNISSSLSIAVYEVFKNIGLS